MLYLLVILPAAIWFGLGPAIAASLLAFLAFDWFHIQPLHVFTIADPAEWLALLLLLLVSVVTAQLAAAQRRRADEAQRREREARALHELGRLLVAHDTLDQSLSAAAGHLRAELGLAGCAILMRDATGRVAPRVNAGVAVSAEPTAAEWLATRPERSQADGRWVRIRRPERPAAGEPALRVTFVPLRARESTVGMLRLAAPARAREWTPEAARLVDAAASQIALAIERARLRQEATEAEVLRQTDEARQALLASVSHDLRTPLASIKASAGSLLQGDVTWPEEERRAFAAAIVQEADRLNRLVGNLLDMSRIEAGAIRPDREWYPVEALVDDVVGRLRPLAARHQIVVDVPDTLPPAPIDYVQIGQVLTNLVENAIKYTPPGSTIAIAARAEDDSLRLSVEDDGPGIPAAALPRIFDKFYRVTGGDTGRTAGTGLGLAVARGLVEAHGGAIRVQSQPPGKARGTVFVVTLPLRPAGMAPPPLAVEEEVGSVR
jgi:two-component system sensor histidine kinase KdpD